MSPEFIILPKVTEQNFEEAAYKWLSEGDLTPDDIIENIITENNMVFIPLYMYRSKYSGTCSASLGYWHREKYQEYDSVNKKHVTKTRSVIRYIPHSQVVHGEVSTIVYVGKNKYSSDVIDFFERTGWTSADLISIVDYGADAEKKRMLSDLIGLDPEMAWNIKAKGKAHDKVRREILAQLPSKEVRNFSMNVSTENTQFLSVIIPIWIFMYNYDDKEYYFAVDANNPDRQKGVKPEDKKRKAHLSKIGWIGWLGGLGISAGTTYYLDGDNFTWAGISIFVVGFILTAIGVSVEKNKIKNASKKIRQAKLKERKDNKPKLNQG